MSDHIHIFSDLHPIVKLAGYVKDIKLASGEWLKNNKNFSDFTGWQEEYGAFTCSNKEKNVIINYVKNQKEHHKKENFYDEYKRLLIEHEIDFDERYLLCS